MPSIVQTYIEQEGTSQGRFLRAFDAWLGNKPITLETLMQYRAHTRRAYGKPSSANRYLGALGPALRWARLTGNAKISKDDISDALQAFKVEASEPAVASRAQLKAILKAVHDCDSFKAAPDYRRFCLLALTTGARVGELVRLKASDFDVENGLIRIDATKTNSKRVVPVQWSLSLQALLPHLAKRRGPMFTLCGPRHGPHPPYWETMFGNLGFPFVAKSMRSTAEAYYHNSGIVPYDTVLRMFGHSSAISLKNYGGIVGQVTGRYVEEWMDCKLEFESLTLKCLGEI
jgi:integrase